MKMNREKRLCELGFAIFVSALLLSMVSMGGMARQNDWSIWHNEEYVPNGGFCHILKDSGDNHVEGTFEWVNGSDPGISFNYTYDGSHFYAAPASWSSPCYSFDFYTNWEHPYAGFFEIIPNHEGAVPYYCFTYT